jgi:hypothetical protein
MSVLVTFIVLAGVVFGLVVATFVAIVANI